MRDLSQAFSCLLLGLDGSCAADAARRTFVVTAPYAILRNAPHGNGAAVARLRRGVIGVLHPCAMVWCRVSTHGYSGFVRRTQIWGTARDAGR